ncbi:hypothetical protein ATANTOWER_029333 [Ataeniobius toweri]|uniref:Uncharacterized protein n=1 Tax=Ataeniobius toweri TaxID=208326 RepID=A0ABU7BC22_9TELE|nr:hypothetical protein [Ataeniobius toweri]
MISSNSSSSCRTEFNLIQVNGTWTRQTGQCKQKEGKSSDAKILFIYRRYFLSLTLCPLHDHVIHFQAHTVQNTVWYNNWTEIELNNNQIERKNGKEIQYAWRTCTRRLPLYPGPGRGGGRLSTGAQTSLSLFPLPLTSGGSPRRSQASRETYSPEGVVGLLPVGCGWNTSQGVQKASNTDARATLIDSS